MLTGLQVAFIGGDARQLEVIKRCLELDANVILIGFENLQSGFSGANNRPLLPDTLKDVDALVLPIVGTDDKGFVESIFSSSPLQLTDEIFGALPKKAQVYTGIAKPFLASLMKKHSISYIEMLSLDDVAILNSIPTAEGALMMAIQNTDITIHRSRSIVLGLGRVGMTLARTLHHLGAIVKVGVRKPEHAARVYEMGLTPFYIKQLKDQVKDTDIFYNTVPKPIVTAEVIANMPHHCLIIDLASAPGGVDFRFAEKRGIKALLAPGLPGIVAPKTAGQIIANTLTRLVLEHSGNQGE